MASFAYQQWGRVAYPEAYARQKKLVLRRIAQEIPDTLVAVEHPPVLTIGRMGSSEHILVSKEYLAAQEITTFPIDRGGDITYHGPGQAVFYPILDLKQHVQDLHKTIHLYEEAIIRLLARYAIKGRRYPDFPGVWVGEAKIAALGIGVKQWVTYHGVALNVFTNLEHFNYIIPCGIVGKSVTSMTMLTGETYDLLEIQRQMALSFAEVFDLQEVGDETIS